MAEPARNKGNLALDTPAARLVRKLLPAGSRRINRVMENVWSRKKASAFRMRAGRCRDTQSRATQRANMKVSAQPSAAPATASSVPSTRPKA